MDEYEMDDRVAKALGGALASNDPNRFMQDVLKFSFQILPLIRPGYLKEVPKQGFAQGGHVLEDDYPTHYLPEVGRQVMAEGGTPTVGSGRFASIDPSLLVGQSTEPFRGGEEYTDAGGQKIAAPFVKGTSGGYPTYDFSAPSESTGQYSANLPGDTNPFEPLLQWNWLSKLMGYAEGGGVEGDVQFAPPEVEQAMRTAQEVAQEPRPFGEEVEKPREVKKEYEPFSVLPFKEDESGIHFDPHAGLLGSIISGLTAPGDVLTGKLDPMSDEGIKRAMDVAGLATSGSLFGTRPAGALASGASRPVEEVLAGIGHNQPPEEMTSTYQRLINPAGFYSHGHEVAMTQLPEGPRTWQEIQALLKKGNVKKEELSWAGLHPEAYDPAQKVTREEIAEKFERNFPQVAPIWKEEGAEMAPKWEQYTAPGGENYSESILTLPYARSGSDYTHPQIQRKYADELEQLEANVEATQQEKNKIIQDSGNYGLRYKVNNRDRFIQYLKDQGIDKQNAEAVFDSSRPSDVARQLGEEQSYLDSYKKIDESFDIANNKAIDANLKYDALLKKMQEESAPLLPEYTKEYFSSAGHLGSIDNPLLHQRWKERVGPEGERILSNEELQSDWAQQGREQGFKNPEAVKAHQELDKRKSAIVQEEQKAFKENRDEFDRKVAPLIEQYNRDEAALVEQYSPKMTPEETIEYNILNDIIVEAGAKGMNGDLSKQEVMRFRYLSNKAHAEEKKLINQDYIIQHDYNEKVQPFVDESLAKIKEIDNSGLSEAEKQRLRDHEEARYIEKVKPYDDWIKQALKENKRRMEEFFEKSKELRKKHDESVLPLHNEFEARAEEIDSKYAELSRAIKEERAKLPKSGGIPLVPHVGTTEQWTELGVKHALQHALESGHDQIFIMGGQEQARRYQSGLRQAVDNIRWEEPGTVQYPTLSSVMGEPAITNTSFRTVYAKPKNANYEYKFVVDKDGRVTDSNLSQAKGEKISAIVGSDLAKQIMKEESGNVPMKNYIMNAEGYTQHYERKMPSVYKDIIKKYLKVDPKIESGPLREKGGSSRFPTDDEIDALVENITRSERDELSQQAFGRSYDDLSPDEHDELYELAHEAMFNKWYKQNKSEATEGAHGTTIHITPEMREAYKKIKQEKGAVFPGYKKGGTVQKALDIVRRGDAR